MAGHFNAPRRRRSCTCLTKPLLIRRCVRICIILENHITRNFVRPFLFEHLDIRGAVVHLHEVWQALQANRAYAPPVARLLGEMCAVTALIAANLKQAGRMSFQLKGQGPVQLLVLDCDEQLRMRGMARADAAVAEAAAPDLLGHGQLALTLDLAAMEQPWQSLVPLDGDSIAAIFEHFLNHSEQQPTRLFLAADGEAAAGLFLQKLPDADRRDPDGWNRVQVLAGTVRPEELTGLPAVQLLARLFPEEDVRLFDPRPVAYHCPEDWPKVEGMLRSLGRAECESVLREHGEIHIHDEICGRDYRFDAAKVAALFDRD
ncbi:MAG: Hsp33 family molecular chaperone HslO [Thiobacillus sp.]|nr:Hsp33 family molecular chaperone HslO [Thiobacillus sp.]